MEDYKYLHQIENVARDNEFCSYIVKRVMDDDYRGYQCSQHNRLTFDYFRNLINIIYDIAGESRFYIHVGDDNGIKQSPAQVYYEIVNKVKEITGKGTINSIKKNTFPDIARMGFLQRYDKNDELIDENLDHKSVYKVGLSKKGIAFAISKAFEKIKLFTDGVDIITKNTASELVEFLYLNDYGIDNINLKEYMYIFSDDRIDISFYDKVRIFIEYRRLNNQQKEQIDSLLKLYCSPSNRKRLLNKTLLRDYSNWKNESQQIYSLLANSTYFKVDKDLLILNTSHYGLFSDATFRGSKAKTEYFNKHGIIKTAGYELHHIVPFSMAQNKEDVLYIDDYKNLIYLEKSKHIEFTSNNNKNVKMKYNDKKQDLLFLDFDTSYIIVNIPKDALFSIQQLPFALKHNKDLLKKFYYL